MEAPRSELPGSQKQLETIISTMRQLERNRNTHAHGFGYALAIHTLSATSWNTANSTGGISYMEYAIVKQYTEIYEAQQMFLSMQERLVGSVGPLGILPVVLDRDPKRTTDAQLLEIEQTASAFLTKVNLLESLAKILNAECVGVLSRK